MKLIIYSLNYYPELTGIGKYNGEFADELVRNDIDTHIITAPPYYPEWKVHPEYKNSYMTKKVSKKLTVHRCPLYVPKSVTTLKRLLHLASFALSSAFTLFRLIKLKPDVLFIVQPTLFCVPAALIYCKFTGARSVLHVQDFEVDAMFGLGLKKSNKLKTFVTHIESWLTKKFDVVSTISNSMLNKAEQKGVKPEKLFLFPNWADTESIKPEISGEQLRSAWGFALSDYLVLYSGNIGAKQGLEVVLDAAENLVDKPFVKFLIIGNGVNRDSLQAEAVKRGLDNIFFKPLQPWKLMPEVLAAANLHLVVQKSGVADAVLPSKLTNILAAGGNALVTAGEGTELYTIAQKYPGIYKCVEPENTTKFTQELITLVNENRMAINNVARKYAIDNLNIKAVVTDFISHTCDK